MDFETWVRNHPLEFTLEEEEVLKLLFEAEWLNTFQLRKMSGLSVGHIVRGLKKYKVIESRDPCEEVGWGAFQYHRLIREYGAPDPKFDARDVLAHEAKRIDVSRMTVHEAKALYLQLKEIFDA